MCQLYNVRRGFFSDCWSLMFVVGRHTAPAPAQLTLSRPTGIRMLSLILGTRYVLQPMFWRVIVPLFPSVFCCERLTLYCVVLLFPFTCQLVPLSKSAKDYEMIRMLFKRTMPLKEVKSIQRIQNPSLWKVFQW